MIDMALNGLVAAFIVYATIITLPVTAIISLLVAVFSREQGQRVSEQRAFDFFLASVIILIIDVLIIALYSSNNRTLEAKEAALLDKWMLYFWIPTQIFSVIAVAFLFKRIRM